MFHASLAAEHAHADRGRVAAERVDQARLCAVDLTPSGFAAELGDDLGHLRGAGRADRMALGLEPAGRVDGHLSAEARPALLRGDAARARLEETEALGRHDLGHREAVV